MTTQAPPSSQHLAAALELLDDLEPATQGTHADVQTKAVTATAHAVLVLAEQVAAIRVLIVGNAVSRRADGQSAPQTDGQQAPRADGRQAPQGNGAPKKRRWW